MPKDFGTIDSKDNIESINDFEEEIYKDAPGLDPELEWDEEEYWMKLITKEKIENAAENLVTANEGGCVRNLMITDDNPEFLEEALYSLRIWAFRNHINLVEIDEKDDSWLHEIQSRELFNKLNQPRSVLVIKNYATVNYLRSDDNTPRNFLRDAVMNRHYGCGNDFVPSDELPNLLCVVALNDLSEMHWREEEYSLFDVIHEDDNRALWVNTSYSRPESDMHYVMSTVNKPVYLVSKDKKAMRFDAGDAFGRNGVRLRRPIRFYTAEERTDIIHTYIENNLPYFHKELECLILRMRRFSDEERFVINIDRLRKSFPNIKSIYCTDVFEIANSGDHIDVFDPFELGEYIFSIAQIGDFKTANYLTRRLWALDIKWAKFFREVALDSQLPHDERYKRYSYDTAHSTGLDKLFRIYLLGWYFNDRSKNSNTDNHKVILKKYQNTDKAMELLSVRFKNWDLNEIGEKLVMDLYHLLHHTSYDYNTFIKIVLATERLFPGTLNEMPKKGFEKREVKRWRSLMNRQ